MENQSELMKNMMVFIKKHGCIDGKHVHGNEKMLILMGKMLILMENILILMKNLLILMVKLKK